MKKISLVILFITTLLVFKTYSQVDMSVTPSVDQNRNIFEFNGSSREKGTLKIIKTIFFKENNQRAVKLTIQNSTTLNISSALVRFSLYYPKTANDGYGVNCPFYNFNLDIKPYETKTVV